MKSVRRYFKPKCLWVRSILLMCALTACVLQLALAQKPGETTVSMFAGGATSELNNRGWSPVVGPRIDHAILYPLAFQFALPVFSFMPWLGERVTYGLPELSLLVSPTVGRVSPYLRFGAGWAIVMAGQRSGSSQETVHVALGLRVRVMRSWDVRSEFGLRSINPWSSETTDISGGIGYRF